MHLNLTLNYKEKGGINMDYSLIKEQLQSKANYSHHKESNSYFMKSLITATKIVGERNTPLFQLLILSKAKNYLRFIVLYLFYKNFDDLKEISIKGMDDKLGEAYLQLAINLEVMDFTHNGYELNKIYQLEKRLRQQLIKHAEKTVTEKVDRYFPKDFQEIMKDYDYILKIIESEPDTKLGEIMKNPDHIYIKYLMTYILELRNLDFTKKVKGNFPEDFYTDLGEMAFNLYTKENYRKYVMEKDFQSVLDIGCGNGKFIDMFLDRPGAEVVGVEKQEVVFEKLNEKYKDNERVTILNEDILDIELHKKFDIINIIYMLFYLTHEEKLILFSRLKELLSEDGSIIIGQYYPKFEAYQEVIAQHNKQWDIISRYKYEIVNSLLYSEVLLNEMLDDFQHAEDWKLFNEILEHFDLVVTDISPADDTYYSYFITVKHRG